MASAVAATAELLKLHVAGKLQRQVQSAKGITEDGDKLLSCREQDRVIGALGAFKESPTVVLLQIEAFRMFLEKTLEHKAALYSNFQKDVELQQSRDKHVKERKDYFDHIAKMNEESQQWSWNPLCQALQHVNLPEQFLRLFWHESKELACILT